jgi:hypothetical protein
MSRKLGIYIAAPVLAATGLIGGIVSASALTPAAGITASIDPGENLALACNGDQLTFTTVDATHGNAGCLPASTTTTTPPSTTTTVPATTTTVPATTTTTTPATTTTVPDGGGGGLPAGVTLTNIDGGPSYYATWPNSFPTDPAWYPVGVFPAETNPATLAAEGIDFYTPARNDNAGTWSPTWTNPGGNDQTHVNATAGFYSGGTFYTQSGTQPWGNRAAFDVYGDELDGNCNNWFDALPANVKSAGSCGSWGGLTPASWVKVNQNSKADDPSRPTYIQTTVTFMDGGNNYHYTAAQKTQVCQSADMFSFDVYPIVKRGGHVWDTYDQVREARGYCADARPVMPMIEMDHMDGAGIYPTPAQTTAEVWDAIIGGARGYQYFDQYGNVANQAYTGGGHYAAGAMYQAIKAVDARVASLAPVLNGPTANGYVTATGNVSTLTKYDGSHFYVLAAPHAAGAQTVTFTVAGNPSTVTVIGENRTVPLAGNQFTDTFADANTVHIYQIS